MESKPHSSPPGPTAYLMQIGFWELHQETKPDTSEILVVKTHQSLRAY